MTRPGLVIFDCDGVLVDSEPISNTVLARMISEAGLPTTLERSRREYQGMLLVDLAAQVGREVGHPLGEDWIERYERERDLAFERDLRPVAGAEASVRAVTEAGLAACVASQGKREKTELTLGLTGLRALFAPQAIFSAYEVSRGKPFPDVFLHAAQCMGNAPRACAVVEDTASGVTAAVAAGMRAIGYAADSDEQALRAAGAEIIHSHGELPPLLFG